MERTTVPAIVYAAMARHALLPGELKSFEVTAEQVVLYLHNGFVLRVAIVSLPARVVPERTQLVGTRGNS